MALSGSFTGTTSNQYVQPKITWSAKQSISGNYSDVTATLTYSRTNSGYTTSGKWSGSITINGTTTSGSSGSNQIYITQNSNTFAMSATTRVYHSGNGTKSITISATGSIPAASLSSTSISGTVTLDTIPRAGSLDSLTCSTDYLDGTFTYKYTPKSSSFYNRLRVSIPDVVALEHVKLGTKAASQQTGTYTLSSTLLESIYNRYPNASTCTIGFVIETYSDSGYSTKIGESAELKVTSLKFPKAVAPSIEGISWTKTSNEPSTWGMTQNVSKGKMTMSGVKTSYGSPIASYSLTFAGYSSTSSSLTVPNIASYGKLIAVAKVTDTRGRYAEKEVSFTVSAYSKPQLSVKAYRSDAEGNEDTSGEYLYLKATVTVTAVNTNALKTLTLGYKRSDSTGSYTTVTITNGVAKIVALSSDYSWDWLVTAADLVSTVTVNGSISTGEVVLDILANGKGIGLGKVAEKEGLDSAWDFMKNGVAQVDYVVEQGTKGYWFYRKWLSGRAEAWTTSEISFTATPSAILGGYYTPAQVDLPAAVFSKPPNCIAGGRTGTGLGFATISSVSTTMVSLGVFGNQNSTTSYITSIYAMGRWN